MSQSTNGQITYGIPFPEGFQFPWNDEKYEFSIQEWWTAVRENIRTFQASAEMPR